jgi:PTH1 family peptidyl-tRNA hydrolase
MEGTRLWLLVGLGNPGPRHARNRHNVGFAAVERWAEIHAPSERWRSAWKGLALWARLLGEGAGQEARCLLVKPQTFMNQSGETVAAVAAFYHVAPPRILVFHDELDFEFTRIAVKAGGGDGGHRGLRSVVERLGSSDFLRVRIGIGRPAQGDATAWVLSDFSEEERPRLPDLLDRACRAGECVVGKGVAAAMNSFNASA